MILKGFLSENVTLDDFDFFPPSTLNTVVFFFLNPRHSLLLCKVCLPFPFSFGLSFKLQTVFPCS